jgi:hypothetical protein
MWYEWIIIGHLRKCMTPGQKEKEGLEDLNGDGWMVWIRISRLLGETNWKSMRGVECPHSAVDSMMMNG